MTLVLDALAVYRLWRLAAKDTILDGPRDDLVAAIRDDAQHRGRTAVPWQVELLFCPWCLGFWLAVIAVAARRYCPRIWDPIATVLAVSALVGLVAEAEEQAADG